MSAAEPEESESGSPIGNLLSGSWELAQKILENLSYWEVSKLRQVCRTWADVGGMILAKRRPLHYLTIHPHSISTTHGKVAIGEVSAASLLEGFFMHIVSKPRYCLAFCNANWLSRVDIFDQASKKGPITLIEYLRETLPSSCELGVVSATGIVGTVEAEYQGHWLKCAQNMNQEILDFLEGGEEEVPESKPKSRRIQKKVEEKEEQEREAGLKALETPEVWESNVGYSIEVEQNMPALEDADGISILVIPHHPGVKVKFFNISPDKFYSDYRGGKVPLNKLVISPQEFNGLMSLSPSEPLTSLLIFDTGYDDNFTTGFVKAALNRENYNVALGGGVADALYSGSSKLVPSTDQLFGLSVSGPNIMAASVVIPAHIDMPDQLRRFMLMLKSCGLPEKQSVAFMFTCCGRGYSSWRPVFPISLDNVESRAFRKAFPNTPIFGFFGRGEVGITYLPKLVKSGAERGRTIKKAKRTRKAFHQYTTIIVLLSFL